MMANENMRMCGSDPVLTPFRFPVHLQAFLLCICLLPLTAAAAEKGNSEKAGTISQTPTPEQSVDGAGPDEWMERLRGNKISLDQIVSITTQVLRWQADTKIEWNKLWGEFLELAREQGKLSSELWRQYLLGAVQIQISVASEASRADGLLVWIEHQNARVSSDGPQATARGFLETDLSGIPLRTKPKAGEKISYEKLNLKSYSGNGWGWTQTLTNSRFAELRPGPQTFHYRYSVEVFDGGPGLEKQAQTKPLGERVIEGTITWRLLAEGEPPSLPILRPDAHLRSSVESSFRVDYVLRDEQDTTLVHVMIQVDHPPTGMAFDMALCDGNDAWPLGPVAWASGKIGWWAYDADLPEHVQQVDVVLTPSAPAGAKLKRLDGHRLINLNEIYDGPPIVLQHIPIRSQRISMVRRSSPTTTAAREYAMEQLDQADPIVQELKRDGDWARARAQFQRKAQDHPDDVIAHFNSGCLALANGDLADAMKCFVDVRNLKPPEPWQRNIQRQLRRICAMYLGRAEKEDEEDVTAMGALGTVYERGWGVKQNFQEAKRWYVNAANAGHSEAMCRLAAMYEHETGATVHTEKAHEWYRSQTKAWYRKAANLGHEEAKQWLSAHDRN